MRALAAHGLAVWVSDVGGLPPTVDRLRQHERVVRAALETATPLPLRYGSSFRDDEAAREALAEGRDRFAQALERVRDQIEVGLRVSLTAAPADRVDRAEAITATTPGRALLQRRRAELEAADAARQRADATLEELERELSDLALPTVRTADPRGLSLGSLAHLVHKDRLRLYRRRIAALQRARSDLRLSLSGPWAPYSFV